MVDNISIPFPGVNPKQKCLIAIVAIFLGMGLFPGPSWGGIPLWALDYGCHIIDWATGEVLEPELAGIIEDQGVVFHENFGAPGDAVHFRDDPDLKLVHYLGLQNQYYGGPASYVDPDNSVMTTEGHFYHSTDPASLTGWRTAWGAELHWTKDLRYVRASGFDSLNAPVVPGEVAEYAVARTDLSTLTQDTFVVAGTVFRDSTIASGIGYEYRLLSRKIDDPQDSRVFSNRVVEIGTEVDPGPHFWVVKQDYQERYYDMMDSPLDSSIAMDWPIRFFSDEVIGDPQNLQIEIRESPNKWINVPYTLFADPVVYEPGTGAISADWPTDTGKILATGGVVYRLIYNGMYFPEQEIDGTPRYFWSSINNRTMSCTWFSYLTNVHGSAWVDGLSGMVGQLVSGADPTGTGEIVQYDGIFLDSVMGINSGSLNKIAPYEFDLSTYRSVTNDLIRDLCQQFGSDAGFWANTGDLRLLEMLDGAVGFVGYMDENLVLQTRGWYELGQALWGFRAHPGWQNVMLNTFDYQTYIPERRQSLAAYLLARNPVENAADPRALFGFGVWNDAPTEYRDKVTVLPEQMLGIGDDLVDPFAGANWPSASAWGQTLASRDSLLAWLQSIPGGNALVREVNGRAYLVMEYDLVDGLPAEANEILTVWDMGDTLTTAQVSLAQLFPEKTEFSEFYRLGFDGPALLAEGGRIHTIPISIYSTLPYSEGTAEIFFSKPVRSPWVSPIGYVEPGQTTLQVRADHWNGNPLAGLEVDNSTGGLPGWPGSFEMVFSGTEGIYTYSGPVTLPSGSYPCRIVARGDDGLMYFGNLEVSVFDAGPTISQQAAYPILAYNPEGTIAIATEVVFAEADSLAVTLSSPVWGITAIEMRNDGIFPDVEAADSLFTSIPFAAEIPPGTCVDFEVCARGYLNGIQVGAAASTIQVSVVESLLKFQDGTDDTGGLADPSMDDIYSSIYFETDMGGTNEKAMVLTKDGGDNPQLFRQIRLSKGSPFMEDQQFGWLDYQAIPPGGRGLCVADFDNDGDQDIFIGNDGSVLGQSPQLFVNTGSGYEDRTSTHIDSDALFAIQQAHAAAWGDFNLDGFLDLFVSCVDHTGPMKDFDHLTSEGTGSFALLRGYFENDLHQLALEDTGFLGDLDDPVLSVSWSDITADGMPDLVLGINFPSPYNPRVFKTVFNEGSGFSLEQIVNELPTQHWTFDRDVAIRSLEWGDFNHDDALDLIVVESGPDLIGATAYSRAAALSVDPVNGFSLISSVPGDPQKWFGSLVGDLNLDGQDDVTLLPEQGLPLLFLSSGPFGGGYSYSNDRSFALGLKATTGPTPPVTGGGVLADFNADKDPDLYLGRQGTQSSFFRNVRPGHVAAVDDTFALDILPNDGPTGDAQKWVQIRLESSGSSNASLTGARVRVRADGHAQTKFIDGGSGRGGQSANQLIFGLGDFAQPTVDVDVVWPYADVAVFPSNMIRMTTHQVPVGETTTIFENGGVQKSIPAISVIPGSLKFTYQAFPGGADWVFEWETSIKTDLAMDAVQWAVSGDCPATLPGIYGAGDPDVEISGYPTTTGYHHVLILRNQICGGSGCSVTFQAYSGLDAQHEVWSGWSGAYRFKVCMQP